MNHQSIVAHESERIYRHRAYILARLDDRHFSALNEEGHVLGLNGYCLDALDYLPAGGMRADKIGYHSHGQQTEAVRGRTTDEIRKREVLAAQLIAEILFDEEN